jgi:hypothetical protein
VSKTCFVAMPITTSQIYNEKLNDDDHFAHVLDHLFTPALEKASYDVISPSVLGSELIHAEIIKNLEQADLVLCDLSSLNPNVFFELGIRTSLDGPVAIVKDSLTAAIPFDLSAINIHTYDGSLVPWTLDSEIERLVHHLKNATLTATSGNAMWRFFGLTKRASPSQVENNPIEAKIDLLIAEITELRASQAVATVQGSDGKVTRAQEIRSFQLLIRNVLNKRTYGASTIATQYDEESRTIVITTDGRLQDQAKNDLKAMAPPGINLHFRPLGYSPNSRTSSY